MLTFIQYGVKTSHLRSNTLGTQKIPLTSLSLSLIVLLGVMSYVVVYEKPNTGSWIGSLVPRWWDYFV